MGKRTIVLCFDGTSNMFREDKNTNVVHLMSMLEREPAKVPVDPKDESATLSNGRTDKGEGRTQRIYYQTGIGTYDPTGKESWWIIRKSKLIMDQAVAFCLQDHVLGGYKFLMEAYRPGDEICMFGFSRGAYTARALAGMLHVVGLLPPNNMELVPFAYDVFKKSKDQGLGSPSDELCDKFKATFARSVEVHFVGLWDTVSSVGLWPRSLPNTNQNKSVKIVRHALSLDENRAKFKAEPWSKPTKAQAEADRAAVHVSEDETDIKEVWFSGYHGDVGGGNEKTTTMNSLSNIPLRWLVREAMEHTSIRWRPQVLETFHIHKRDEMSEETRMEYIERECQEAIHAKTNGELQNAFSPWWILEVLPLWHLWWDGAASAWVPTISWNIGAPRQIGSEGREDQRTFVHSSVSTRLWLNGDYVNAAKWKESEVEVVDDWATPEVVRKRRRQEGRNLPVKEEKRRPWWRWLF